MKYSLSVICLTWLTYSTLNINTLEYVLKKCIILNTLNIQTFWYSASAIALFPFNPITGLVKQGMPVDEVTNESKSKKQLGFC
jgi:hypothetical protein